MFDFLTWDFVLRFLNVTLCDIVLSGDNAIVIGMAAASLPLERRKWALIVGGAAAIGLRMLLTSVATLLMLIPLLSAIGGLVLIWVAYKLLKLDIGEEEPEEEGKARSAKNFRQAIILILAADFMMSLDNVIAVAGSAHGNVVLLIAGLLISMPLLMTTGGFISLLIDRFKWLVFVGAFAITFTATRMVFEDRFIEARFPQPTWLILTVATLVGLVIPSFFVWLNRQKTNRQAKSPVSVAEKVTSHSEKQD